MSGGTPGATHPRRAYLHHRNVTPLPGIASPILAPNGEKPEGKRIRIGAVFTGARVEDHKLESLEPAVSTARSVWMTGRQTDLVRIGRPDVHLPSVLV